MAIEETTPPSDDAAQTASLHIHIDNGPTPAPVDSDWDHFDRDELAIVLSHYDVGNLSKIVEFKRGSRRAPKLRIRSNRGEYLLKRRAPGRDDPNRVGFTHALQRALRSGGCPLPELVLTREHAGSMVIHSRRVYELYEFVVGGTFDRSPASAEASGHTLGSLHRSATHWAEGNSAVAANRAMLTRASFHSAAAVAPALDQIPSVVTAIEPDLTREEIAEDCRWLAKAYAEASRRVTEGGWAEWPKQVIHGDWHSGNLIFRGQKVCAVLDFDSARLEPRMADVANGALQFSMVMAGLTEVPDWPPQPDVSRLRSFVAGYRRAYDSSGDKPLSDAELAALPWLMVEALIAETIGPIAAAGSFAGVRGSSFLRMIRRKADWLRPRAAKLVEFLKD
jgi:Ser/Thr protein kinase RdoA (MazF antagonist)